MPDLPKLPDIINPNSNLTPAIAGSLTTTLSAPLIANFDTLKFPWVALGVSLIFALIIVWSFKEVTSKTKCFLYCILNTLLIFSVAATIQSQIDRPPPPIEPIAKKDKSLACKILDDAQMSPNERQFIKNLLLINDAEGPRGSWKKFLTPSKAWAQQGQQPASPPPAVVRDPDRDSRDHGSLPRVTPQDLERSKDLRQQRQRTIEEQKRYYQQNTWFGRGR